MSIIVPILLYHSISRDATPQFAKWTVHPEVFAAHIAYLHDHCYTPITVTQLATAMTDSSVRIPDWPVVLTFDDGFADFYTGALPLLKSYGFATTLYITTGFIGDTSRWLYREGEGERPMLTWSQIAEISTSGVECGAHSHSHPQLDTLPPSVARDEIIRSKTILEHHLGRQVSTFAYPHGYYGSVVRRLVQQAGFSSACAGKNAMSATTDDRFALARITVTADTDVEGFGRLLAGRGLRIAPTRERVRTKGWRLVRQSARLLRRRPSVETRYDKGKRKEDKLPSVKEGTSRYLDDHNKTQETRPIKEGNTRLFFNIEPPRLKAWPVWGIRIVRNALIDLRYGGLLSGVVKTRYAHLGAVETANCDYEALSHIFANRIKPSDVLVDIGCGKGRVINWWLHNGLCNRIIGIELDEEIANRTRQRVRKYKNVTIIAGDAIQNIPADGTLFYLYNPFDAQIMEAFKNRLMSLFGKDSDITILYYNCRHVHVFQEDPAWIVKVTDVGGHSAFPFPQLAVIKMR